jgi:hypothetical protein
MKEGFESKVTTLTNSLDLERARRKPRQRTRLRPAIFSILASLGIFGGISALFVGLVFVIVHGVLSADIIFNKVGTGLLIVAIPMILLGSIFLDEIEGKK